jgi:hypothetical protein
MSLAGRLSESIHYGEARISRTIEFTNEFPQPFLDSRCAAPDTFSKFQTRTFYIQVADLKTLLFCMVSVIQLQSRKVIVFAKILVDRGNVFLAVTIARHSCLFGNLVKNAQ